MSTSATASPLPAAAGALQPLAVAGVLVRRDSAGRFSLNDLHRAAGGEKRHGPSYWLANAQTRGLIDELAAEPGPTGIPGGPLVTVNDGLNNGTWAVRELVYAYAMWISPAFHLRVIRAYDALVSGPAPVDPRKLSRLDLIQIAMDAERERLELTHKLAEAEPKVAALARIANAAGTCCITDAAKALQVQPFRLRDWLIRNQWIYFRPGTRDPLAYQHRIQAGYLTHKVITITRPDGSDKVISRVHVTAAGIAKLGELLQAAA